MNLCGQSLSKDLEEQRKEHKSKEYFAKKERNKSLKKAFETKNYCCFAFHMFSVRRLHKRKRRHTHTIKDIDKQQQSQRQTSASND